MLYPKWALIRFSIETNEQFRCMDDHKMNWVEFILITLPPIVNWFVFTWSTADINGWLAVFSSLKNLIVHLMEYKAIPIL